MYGQFYRDMADITDFRKTWVWLVKCDLKCETEALIFAAQEQALRTNYVKNKIDRTAGTADSPLCRFCKKKGESVSHITS